MKQYMYFYCTALQFWIIVFQSAWTSETIFLSGKKKKKKNDSGFLMLKSFLKYSLTGLGFALDNKLIENRFYFYFIYLIYLFIYIFSSVHWAMKDSIYLHGYVNVMYSCLICQSLTVN